MSEPIARQAAIDDIAERVVGPAKSSGRFVEEYRGFALIVIYGGGGWPRSIDAEPVSIDAHTLCFPDGKNGWIPAVSVDLKRHKDEIVRRLRDMIDRWCANGVQPQEGRQVMFFATLEEAMMAADALQFNERRGEA